MHTWMDMVIDYLDMDQSREKKRESNKIYIFCLLENWEKLLMNPMVLHNGIHKDERKEIFKDEAKASCDENKWYKTKIDCSTSTGRSSLGK